MSDWHRAFGRMSELFLDFRPPHQRASAGDVAEAMESLIDGLRTESFETDHCLVVVGRVDRLDLWGSYRSPDGNLFVALGGRLALEEHEWRAAESASGGGGLACKAVALAYQREGPPAFARLNGNFGVFLHDAARGRSCFATDRLGVFLLYGAEGVVFGSHPDLVARLAGVAQPLDRVSMAEFLKTGRLTFPFTYYKRVRTQEYGAVHHFEPVESGYRRTKVTPFWDWKFAGGNATEEELANALASAFHNSVRRRSLARLGRVGIGLSGGLDSRVILASARGGAEVVAFSLFDEENEEWRIAGRLARAAGVSLRAIRRDFDYYGRTAEEGVRLYGGMGCLMNNHYLGAREALREMRIDNLLTGCYCDYVFKALALNTVEHPLTRRESLAPFRFSFYRPEFPLAPALDDEVRARHVERYPFPDGAMLDEAMWWEAERRRVFPLAYEGDLAQRVLPQRTMPWFVPIADNDLLDVYCRLPPGLKLNTRVFRRMVLQACPPEFSRIPDNNTGAPVHTGVLALTANRYRSALMNRLRRRMKPGIATRGSWPDWQYYVQHSGRMLELWRPRDTETTGLLAELIGESSYGRPVSSYQGRQTEFFLRLLTLKLWLEQVVFPRGAEASLSPVHGEH